ncbi:MAG: peptidoglycan-associated lipoprotein Pal [Desulfuromonadales bacterium]|nr:peptidoglycan-associated lipoprotein Pal [Desulfuromonadales bacterium]
MFKGKILIAMVVLALAAGCAKKSTIDTAAQPPAPAVQAQAEGTQSPSSEPNRPAAVAVESSAVAGLAKIYFEFDSYTLSAEARQVLQNNAEWLRLNPTVRLIIEGHTDERGSDAYNLSLGERRARAAREYLATLGVDQKRVSILSFGEERPVADGQGEEIWGQNRRGEFVPAPM